VGGLMIVFFVYNESGIINSTWWMAK
jgi:hypothetical protein